MGSSTEVHKAIGLPEDVDPTHTYVFRSGEYGTFYQYWYADRGGTYWKYTNAPEDHEDFDPAAGPPLMDPEQPMPHTDPQFYTPEGFKRHIGVPPEVEPEPNESYNPASPRDIWFEMFQMPTGEVRFVYLDKDVKEDLDLYVQHQLRVADASLSKYRKFAANLFRSAHPRDKITAAILFLVDQGYYQVEELVNAVVADLEFTDQTMVLLGRKLICDDELFDFFTSLTAGRALGENLFMMDGYHGRKPLGTRLVNATFAYLKVSPQFLLYWHATHMFSRIVSHLALQGIPVDKVEDIAFAELARVFTSNGDIRFMVDFRVKEHLLEGYEESFMKSIKYADTDDYGVAQIFSDLVERREDEMQFSVWLHTHPMHDLSPAEEEAIEMMADEAMQDPEEEGGEEGGPPEEGGGEEGGDAAAQPEPGDQGAV